MQKNYNEKLIYHVIEKNHPAGIGVNQIVEQTGVSKQSTNKILHHLEEIGEINYPPQNRGKRTLITLRQTSRNDVFMKIKKQQKWIDISFVGEPPFFVTDVNGVTYVGLPDDFEEDDLILYDVHKLDTKKREWKKLQRKAPYGKSYNWCILHIKEIDSIYIPDLKKLGLEQISTKDAMTLWHLPSHKIQRSTKCDWDGDKISHSKQCDSEIHELLTELFTNAKDGQWKKLMKTYPDESDIRNEKSEEFSKRFGKLIYYIIQKGGKIPGENF